MPPADEELSRERLSSLTHDELVERLLSLAQRDDALRLALAAEAQAASGNLDVRTLKKQLTARLRVTDRSYNRGYARRYAREANEAVDVLARDRSSPYRFVLIAEELEQAGREREALVWLERGVAAFPPPATRACASASSPPTYETASGRAGREGVRRQPFGRGLRRASARGARGGVACTATRCARGAAARAPARGDPRP